MDDKELEKALRKLGKEKVEYPPELKSSTKAEFTTMVRTNRKKGCPLTVLTLLTVLSLAYFVGTLL